MRRYSYEKNFHNEKKSLSDIKKTKLNCRCAKHVGIRTARIDLRSLNIHGDVYRVDCVDSDHFIAATLNNEIIDINNTYSDRFEDKWQEAQTDRDIVLFYILSQIIYPDFDTPRPEKFESPYALVDKHDVILLRWQGGKAIGFYTVKPTGNCGYRKIK